MHFSATDGLLYCKPKQRLKNGWNELKKACANVDIFLSRWYYYHDQSTPLVTMILRRMQFSRFSFLKLAPDFSPSFCGCLFVCQKARISIQYIQAYYFSYTKDHQFGGLFLFHYYIVQKRKFIENIKKINIFLFFFTKTLAISNQCDIIKSR